MSVLTDELRERLERSGVDPDKAEAACTSAFPSDRPIFTVAGEGCAWCQMCGALVLRRMRGTHAITHVIAGRAPLVVVPW